MTQALPQTWEPRVPRQQIWPIMAGILLVLLLASLDQTIVSTAMPKVIASLKGFDRYSWVATAYLLTSTVSVPIYGRLSDIYGRKIFLLGGIVVFLVGSALSGMAQSMNWLILARGLQGLGAGALMPIVIATMGDLFSPKERGKWQGVTGAIWGFAAIIGPSTGGWITDHLSWRWVFYVNIPIGIAAFIVLLWLMPPLRFGKPDVEVDYLGAGMLIAALVPLMLAFTWAGSTYPWTSWQVIGLLVWSVLALAVFVFIEAREQQPIVEPGLFKNRIYSVSVAVSALIGAAMFGSIFFIPLFIQGVIGISATTSGTIMTPLMMTAIAGSVISGQLLSRWGRYRIIALTGLLLMIAGSALLLRLNVNSHYTDVLWPMLIIGAGMGFGMALYTVVVQNAVPPSKIGQVTSGLTFFRALGGTIGLALMGSFLTARFKVEIGKDLPATVRHAIPASALQRMDNPQALISPQSGAAMHQFFAHFGPSGLALYHELQLSIKRALAAAIHDVFLLGLAIAIVAAVLVLFLPEIPLRAHAQAPPIAEEVSYNELGRVAE
jgi:EmrB/QacA subfamily drug resistance transporter